MATQKFTTSDKHFFKNAHQYDSCYNTILTKLCAIKLETTKHNWSHLMEKNRQMFWPTQYICMCNQLKVTHMKIYEHI